MTEQYLLRLPWPPKELSPNSRKDRRGTTEKRRKYRHDWFWICKQAKAQITPDAHLSITFHAPDERRRDLDNMLSSIKYGLDGLAEASGVDDYGWSLSIRRGEKVQHGCVMVHVNPPETVQEIEFRE
jgi:crossover junction endodeoxyribonuclease RusA